MNAAATQSFVWKGFCPEHTKEISALRHALREERTMRKQLEQEVLQLKKSLRGGTEFLRKQIEDMQLANNHLSKQLDNLSGANEVLCQEADGLKSGITELSQKIENMDATLAWFRKNYFGRKTEDLEQQKQTATSDTQIVAEPTEKRPRGQQRGANGHGRTNRGHLTPEEEFLDIADCACAICKIPYRLLPETDDSDVVEFEVRPRLKRYRRRRYVSQCLCNGKKLLTAPPPQILYGRTNIGNSLWVYLSAWRYLQGVPLHRVLQDLKLRKLPLAAGTVTGGFKRIDKLLDTLYEKIAIRCKGASLWNADETSWKVFEENNGTRCKKQWWFWLMASSDAIVYLLDKSRSRTVPQDFFAGSTGVLITDRLASYKALSEAIKNAWCWVHVRRDFLKIFEGMPQYRNWAEEWLKEIGLLFALNHKRVKLWNENQPEWKKVHQAVEQHVEGIKERWEEQLKDLELCKKQRKALRSLQTHWEGLTIFLTDPRIPLENNRAERLLRNIVVSRKNSYGSGKEWSGMLAAKFFTVFQTWLVNGLDPQALLLDYFNECSKTRSKPPPTDVNNFLPWTMSLERKQTFAIPKNIKHPG